MLWCREQWCLLIKISTDRDSRLREFSQFTIFEFNCDSFVRAFHQEPTIAFESVRASRSRLDRRAQHCAQTREPQRVAYLTSFMMAIFLLGCWAKYLEFGVVGFGVGEREG